ncbi:MAG: hypothetical protein KGL39_40450 [Patescibacteria group bacterium]|nr:hypothetical protein [Patescibacteria group bacterium]
MTDPLYPIPANVEATRFIFARARRDRDERGRMLLPTPLTAAERQMVQNRMHELAEPLRAAKPAELRKALLEAFPDVEVEMAKARAKALADGMEGLPLFAVRRAALQISQGGVGNPDRVALRTAAEEIARGYWNEASVGSMLLHARKNPQSTPGEAERARVEAGFAWLLGRLAQGANEGPASAAKAARRRTKRMIREDREHRAAEYADSGLDPVFADKAGKIVVSLVLLEKLGWRVEQVGRETVLVRPEWLRGKTEERTE